MQAIVETISSTVETTPFKTEIKSELVPVKSTILSIIQAFPHFSMIIEGVEIDETR